MSELEYRLLLIVDWLIFVKGVKFEEFEVADAFTNSIFGVSLFTRK